MTGGRRSAGAPVNNHTSHGDENQVRAAVFSVSLQHEMPYLPNLALSDVRRVELSEFIEFDFAHLTVATLRKG
jgi:hypothetical protein